MLARHFGRVEYYTPWKDAYPTSTELDIGKGFEDEGFYRIANFWENIDSVDLFVFPDIYDGDIQLHLQSLGKNVWGSRKCEQLEMFRAETKDLMRKLDMPVNAYKVIHGVDALREHLNEVEDRYIKVSQTRGDVESFHHIDGMHSAERLDEIKHHLGARGNSMEFIVEEPIKSKIEVGYDGFTVDGLYPKGFNIFGYEIKDAGYIGTVLPYAALPEPVRWVNAKLAPIFKKYGYRGCWSSEIRVGEDNKYYLLDPCCRCGSPPSELYAELFANWGEIIWQGSQGVLVEPVPVAKYGVEVMVHSSWSDKNWLAVRFPEEIEQWVKVRFACKMDGVTYSIPQNMEMGSIGSIVAVDNSIAGAIKKVVEIAKKVEGYSIDIRMDSIAKAMDEIKTAEVKHGYKFGPGPIPTLEQVARMVI